MAPSFKLNGGVQLSPEGQKHAAKARRRAGKTDLDGVNEDDLVEVDERYAHLIEPIRDLVKNFKIDLAGELEDYLDELQDVTFALEDDPAKRKLNFAEAALLIQGSACIYARKVEFLHKLLFRALEGVISLREKREKRDRKKKEKNGITDAAEDDDEEDVEVMFSVKDFIKLDDLPQADEQTLNVEFSRKEENAKPQKRFVWQDDDETVDFLRSLDRRTSLGIAVGNVAPLRPEDRDPRLPGEMDIFRINTLPTSEDGTLQLETNFEVDVDPFATEDGVRMPAAPQANNHANDPFAQFEDDAFNDDFDPFPGEEVQIDSAPHDTEQIRDPVMVSKSGLPLSREQLQAMSVAEIQQYVAQHGGSRQREKEVADEREEDEATWKFLDLHEEAKPSQLRPFRLGSTFTLPPSLRSRPNAEKKNPLAAFTLTMRQMSAGGANSTAPRAEQKLSVAHWPEFDYAYMRIARSRSSLLRKLRLLDPVERTFPMQEQENAASAARRNVDDYQAAGVALPEMDDFGGDFDGGFDDDGFEFEPAVEHDKFFSQVPGPPGTQAAVRQEQPDTEISFEELCRRHIEDYMRKAEASVTLSRLQKTVAEWQSRVEPTLELVENTPRFDIGEYGHRIVKSFELATSRKGTRDRPNLTLSQICRRVGQPAAPSKLMAEDSLILDSAAALYSGVCPQYEVCRAFVASLQLANLGNIEIQAMNIDADGIAHDISVTLLDDQPRGEVAMAAAIASMNIGGRRISRGNEDLLSDGEDGESEFDLEDPRDRITSIAANEMLAKRAIASMFDENIRENSNPSQDPDSQPRSSQPDLFELHASQDSVLAKMTSLSPIKKRARRDSPRH